MARWFGFNAPFIGGAQNVLSRQEDERLIKNDLLQLILTAPTERLMRPEFGTGVRLFLFENSTPNEIEELRNNIIEQIDRFERRVSVTEVIIKSEPDDNLLIIKIFGFLDIDRFRPGGEDISQADLLVELEIPTSKGPTSG